MIGQTLAHFRITAKLGEGGMGEVYRAEDSRLGREVAIKVLPEAVASAPERLARFDREARVLAALDHSNIAAIYGLEEAEGRKLLVMQLAEGETLAERIGRGPIQIEAAIPVALQIAEALEAAHEKGIIHRDLKPANVKVSQDDQVKLLDFGLAKALELESTSEDEQLLTQSPTLTEQMTGAGVLLGTAAYMSPEQARGQPVDKRADVWAFGCLLYEMLTARRAFPGKTMTDVLAAIVASDPDWAALPAATPRALRRLLRRTLEKDPRERLRDLGDARLELIDAHSGDPEASSESAARPTGVGRWLQVAAGLAVGLLLGALFAGRFGGSADQATITPQPAIRGVVKLPAHANLAYGAAPIGFDNPMVALSPDGRWLVYVGRDGSDSRLYRHDLTGFGPAQPIDGTEGALYAFFAPDGSAVGFVTRDRLKRVSLDGDDLRTLAEVNAATRASWLGDGTIVFADYEGGRFMRVAADGGAEEEIHNPTVGAPMSDILPDGKQILATSRDRGLSADYADILLIDLESDEVEVLIEGGYDARYLPSGHIVFGRAGSLTAVAFDLDSGKVFGEPVTFVSDVAMDSFFAQVQVAIAANGTLAFAPGGERSRGRIGWLDRAGGEGLLAAEPRLYGVLDLAPDDRRLAVHVGDVTDFIWVFDLDRSEGRILRGARPGGWPSWSSSGHSIAFQRRTKEDPAVMLAEGVTGSAPATRIILDRAGISAGGWAPDDRSIVLKNFRESLLGVVEIGSEDTSGGDVVWFPGGAGGAAFSPDGKWLAYSGGETGVWEVYVRSWPEGDVVHQISTGGGIEPRWCPCGELFYRAGDTFWAVEMQTEPELDWQPPKIVFETDFIDTPGASFDISSDGNRLYVVKPAKPDITDRIHVVSDWFEEVGRLLGQGS
jgi:Tol biopolymer transport system component/tRNA A-37 threonylcarbamoyl transferase component Bud32